MIKLLNNIGQGFVDIDNDLRNFNNDVSLNLTVPNVLQKLNLLNPKLSENLKQIKLNMAAFDIAIKTQKVEPFDTENREKVQAARTVMINNLNGIIKNKREVENLCRSNSPIVPSFRGLLDNINEWEFLLTKHIEQYDIIINK